VLVPDGEAAEAGSLPAGHGAAVRELSRLVLVLLVLVLLAVAAVVAPAAAGGTWTPTDVSQAPAARANHTAIWTGTKMIVWGLYGRGLAGGAVYDPATDGWTPTSTTGAPGPRAGHTAVWTGSEMIVWGGWVISIPPPPDGSDGLVFNTAAPLDTGGVYDPATDTWTTTSTVGAPSPRVYHTGVWTGSKMIVWGGQDLFANLNTGGVYDPAADSWRPVSTVGAPAARSFHTAVWTGSKMIVWGGSGPGLLDSGGTYDPVTDTWTATRTSGAPAPRIDHTAVWTGSKMVVWGGVESIPTIFATGGVYDPATNTWSPTSTSGDLVSRRGHAAVWAGSRMLVWGGNDASGWPTDSGGVYDPAADTWRATPVVGAPTARADHTVVWTGSKAIVWGGYDTHLELYLNSGGIYADPGLLPAATDFHTLTPCRLVDTRDPGGPTGGAALGGRTTDTFTVTGGACGVPAAAVAISVNVTAVGPAAAGTLTVYPGNWVGAPVVSNVNFSAAQTRGNNAIVFLATDGTGTIKVKNGSAGAVHVVLDVNGYFLEPF
jgi:N-acetylneuraminic acid mutarotase